MDKNANTTLSSTSRETGRSLLDATGATSTGFQQDNEGLKATYDEMHKEGVGAWFSDGREERETILKMGEPWKGMNVLEIGCGEGQLCAMMKGMGAIPFGIDYSNQAIDKARRIWDLTDFMAIDYREINGRFKCLVMQGVLEHLDDPFGELQWMIEHFKPKTVITSSPCFLNPRGIVWMTLHMLGAVMSKTDLHHLHPWQFIEFADKHGYSVKWVSCDNSWGHGEAMIEDLMQRIPLALKDGNIPLPPIERFSEFLHWLEKYQWGCIGTTFGATMVYRIDL